MKKKATELNSKEITNLTSGEAELYLKKELAQFMKKVRGQKRVTKSTKADANDLMTIIKIFLPSLNANETSKERVKGKTYEKYAESLETKLKQMEEKKKVWKKRATDWQNKYYRLESDRMPGWLLWLQSKLSNRKNEK